MQLFWISSIPFFTTFHLCKAAFLGVFLQVFPKFMIKRRVFLWVTTVCLVLSYTATILLLVFICTPVNRNWFVHSDWKFAIRIANCTKVSLVATRKSPPVEPSILNTTLTEYLDLWNSLDLYIGLVIACLPSLPYLNLAAESHVFNYVKGKITGRSNSTAFTPRSEGECRIHDGE